MAAAKSAEASLATLQAGIRALVEKWRKQEQKFRDLAERESGYAVEFNDTADHFKLRAGELEALLGDPPASPTGEK